MASSRVPEPPDEQVSREGNPEGIELKLEKWSYLRSLFNMEDMDEYGVWLDLRLVEIVLLVFEMVDSVLKKGAVLHESTLR